MAATDIVRAFEEDLQNNVTLTFFVVRVVYGRCSENPNRDRCRPRTVGGVSIRRVLSREL